MFWNFLIEYQAVFASILTLTVTLVVTHILRSMGKIDFSFSNFDFKVTILNSLNEYIEYSNITNDKIDSLRGIIIRFEMIIYNSSDMPKSLTSFNIELENKNSCNLILPIEDRTTSRTVAQALWMDELKILNISPKNMLHLKLISSSNNISELLYPDKYNIYFTCKNTKGKTIRKYISSYHFIG